MSVLRSSAVIAAVASFLESGRVLTIRDGDATYTAGQSKRADGTHGWEVNTYRPGCNNETDDAFWNPHQLARVLVNDMFDKRRVDAALFIAQCHE